jgi:hypothetical protein
LIGLVCPFGLISLREKGIITESSRRETGAFKADVLPAGATLGTDRI